MSYRELWVLVQHLPQESRTQTIMRDDPARQDIVAPETERRFGPWSQQDYLIASLIDAVNQNTHAVSVAGHLKDPVAPEPFPRPGRPSKRIADGRNSETAVLYLERLRDARRQV